MKRLSLYYSRLGPAAQASIWITISNVLIKGIGFFTLPIFSRILSTNQYGQISVYSSWKGILLVFSTLMLWGGIFNVTLVNKPKDSFRIMSSFQGLAFSLTSILFVVTLIFLEPISVMLKMSKLMIVCMFVDFFSTTSYSLWISYERSFYRYRKPIIVALLSSALCPIISYFAVINTPHKAEAYIISDLFVRCIISTMLFFYIQLNGKAFYNAEYWRLGFCFNIILIPHYLSTQVLDQSDRIMINSMCGASDAGIYSVAYTFAMLIQLLTTTINSSFTPWFYRKIKAKQYNDMRRLSYILVLFVAGVTISMICFIPDVFRMMLPVSYYPAIWVIPPVITSTFFMFIVLLFGSIEFYYGENRFIAIASSICALLNVTLNFIFIKKYGFIAAAYTTLICYMAYSFAHYCFMKKILKKRDIIATLYDGRFLVLVSVVTITMMVIVMALYDSVIMRWLFIFVIWLVIILNRDRIIRDVKSLVFE